MTGAAVSPPLFSGCGIARQQVVSRLLGGVGGGGGGGVAVWAAWDALMS